MAWSSETPSYVCWTVQHAKNTKGKMEVHYFLERKDGCADLAVIGRLKNSKRMSFRYALEKNQSVLEKLNSIDDVTNWLDSIVSGKIPHVADVPADTAMNKEGSRGLNIGSYMSGEFKKPIHLDTKFSWIGSSWTCRKRRKHYPSFTRNGVIVSVNDFVYVLAEQNKRLVAYLEDLYEDSKGNKMVGVRWFHKTDEVGIVLPNEANNDREIFFSLCHQDINIECIDGLATVLSFQHYEEFLKVTPMKEVQLVVFFCKKLYEDDGIKPYDITQLQGYWRQEVLRYFNVSNLNSVEGAQALDLGTGASLVGSKKRRRSPSNFVGSGAADGSLCLIKKGSLVEVLSQDSGIRGCWFKALILKKHKDKVKVQYQDINDADDESKKLEEWISTSRVAKSDNLGLRITGRTIVRPTVKPVNEKDALVVGVGMPVDVWWCDGWWEGIVLSKVSEEKFEIYLPGEKKMSTFHRSDLRQSVEWVADEWVNIQTSTDLVSSVLLSMKKEEVVDVKNDDDVVSPKVNAKLTISLPVVSTTTCKTATKRPPVPDLLKEVSVFDLNWKVSKKRSLNINCYPPKDSTLTSGVSGERSSDCEKCTGDSLFSSPVVMRKKRKRVVSVCPHEKSKKFIGDLEKSKKFIGESLFCSSVGQPLTGLVMSR